MSRATQQILSFLSHWGGSDNWLKIAIFWGKTLSVTFHIRTEQSFAFRKMIIVKIFKYMHVVCRKNFLYLARTHKAHFWTHKYGVMP